MGTHDDLLRAVCETPGDDLPRLAFADWLEEDGQPERATFIRTDIEIARLDEWNPERFAHSRRVDSEWHGQAWFRGHWVHFLMLPHGFMWTGTPRMRRGFPWSLSVEHPVELPRRPQRFWDRVPVTHLRLERTPATISELLGVARAGWAGRLSGISLKHGRHGGPAWTDLLKELAERRILELELAEGAVSPAGVRGLIDSPVFSSLTRLALTATSQQVHRELCERLGSDPRPVSLRQLDLSGTGLGEVAIRALGTSRALPHLQSLDLGSNSITSRRAAVLADCLAFAGLYQLGLGSNPIGNAGAATVATCPHLAGLRILDLGFCMVGDDGIRAILDSPLADRLGFLNLTGSPASAEMKEAVRARMGDRVRL